MMSGGGEPILSYSLHSSLGLVSPFSCNAISIDFAYRRQVKRKGKKGLQKQPLQFHCNQCLSLSLPFFFIELFSVEWRSNLLKWKKVEIDCCSRNASPTMRSLTTSNYVIFDILHWALSLIYFKNKSVPF